jgi:hypothetical protein
MHLSVTYCRLYGDYESLIQGDTADALVDFTGGVAEKLVLMNINLQDDLMKTALFGFTIISIKTVKWIAVELLPCAD